jgi:hypothetical protein
MVLSPQESRGKQLATFGDRRRAFFERLFGYTVYTTRILLWQQITPALRRLAIRHEGVTSDMAYDVFLNQASRQPLET